MEKITATYDQDSKRYHRFVLDEGRGIVGNIYVLRTKAQGKKNEASEDLS